MILKIEVMFHGFPRVGKRVQDVHPTGYTKALLSKLLHSLVKRVHGRMRRKKGGRIGRHKETGVAALRSVAL